MSALRGDEAELFRTLEERLVRTVRRSVHAPQALIESDVTPAGTTKLVGVQGTANCTVVACAPAAPARAPKVARRESQRRQVGRMRASF